MYNKQGVYASFKLSAGSSFQTRYRKPEKPFSGDQNDRRYFESIMQLEVVKFPTRSQYHLNRALSLERTKLIGPRRLVTRLSHTETQFCLMYYGNLEVASFHNLHSPTFSRSSHYLDSRFTKTPSSKTPFTKTPSTRTIY